MESDIVGCRAATSPETGFHFPHRPPVEPSSLEGAPYQLADCYRFPACFAAEDMLVWTLPAPC